MRVLGQAREESQRFWVVLVVVEEEEWGGGGGGVIPTEPLSFIGHVESARSDSLSQDVHSTLRTEQRL